MVLFLVIFCVIIALGFGFAAAWSDFKGLIIPNLYSLLILAAFVPAYAAVHFLAPESGYFQGWASHLISFGAVFIITYGLFAIKALGGGDAKLCSVYALWVGLGGIAPFLFFMGITGGVLGLVTLYLNKHQPVKKPNKDSWIGRAQKGKRDVPYGIAITIGAMIAFIYTGYITPQGVIGLTN
ncbi:MAG: hypothetical protein GW903_09555 [Alphaproteobacteria bacterium]|nr:hypothetical protein [Alphaproteobacteria bacterium]NCQ89209.1 hypothetical protein [Alphaproteobacteria bacterium]NCT08115.1 hypothetical protein [Alphaproteobacteria bacterium]